MKNFILFFYFTFFITIHSQEFIFYKTIQEDEQSILEKGLKELSTYKNSMLLQVYMGAIQAKLAQFERNPQQKISKFKQAVNQIESGIKKDPKNIEYRFVRYLIQENAPKILKYQSNLQEDKKIAPAAISGTK